MYMEPKLELDPNDKLYWIFEDWRLMTQDKTTPTPRGDVTKYYHQSHKQYLDNNITCRGFPKQFRPLIVEFFSNYGIMK